MKFNHYRWFEITLVALIVIIHIMPAFSDAYNFPNAWFIRDDAYYYFKVAQNISEGHGSTFDGLNPTNGYHPLWLWVCIPIFALARFDLILPLRILLILLAVVQAITSIMIFRLGLSALSPPTAMLASAFWSFNGYIHYTVYEQGLETALAVFGVVWLLLLLSKFEATWRRSDVKASQLVQLGFLGTLAVFSRLDLIFFVFLIGVWIVFRGSPLRSLLLIDILAILVSLSLAYILRTGFPAFYNYSFQVRIIMILALLIKIPIFYLMGLYQHPRLGWSNDGRSGNSHTEGLNRTTPILNHYRTVIQQYLQNAIHTSKQSFLAVITASASLAFLSYLFSLSRLITPIPESVILVDGFITFLLILIIRMLGYRFSSVGHIKFTLQEPIQYFRKESKRWLNEGATYFGIVSVVLMVYMVWNKLVFDTFTPVSGQIKHWWGTQLDTIYDGPPRNMLSYFGINIKTALNAWQPASEWFLYVAKQIKWMIPGSNTQDERYYVVLLSFILIAIVLSLLLPRSALRSITKLGFVPLFVSGGVQVIYYTSSGYAGYQEWYWIAQMLTILLGGALVINQLVTLLRKAKVPTSLFYIMSWLFALLWAWKLGSVLDTKMPINYFPLNRPYMEILPLLEENTPSGSVIGMTGGGNVGYFIHDRVIVNLDGLINSHSYFLALQSGNAATYLKGKGVDVVYANPGILNLAPYNGQFAPYLQSYGSYSGKDLMYLLPEPKY